MSSPPTNWTAAEEAVTAALAAVECAATQVDYPDTSDPTFISANSYLNTIALTTIQLNRALRIARHERRCTIKESTS